jgi:hypothetical protein
MNILSNNTNNSKFIKYDIVRRKVDNSIGIIVNNVVDDFLYCTVHWFLICRAYDEMYKETIELIDICDGCSNLYNYLQYSDFKFARNDFAHLKTINETILVINRFNQNPLKSIKGFKIDDDDDDEDENYYVVSTRSGERHLVTEKELEKSQD